jgi:Cu(I)/Ag(I) efflux system membrane fusion protein
VRAEFSEPPVTGGDLGTKKLFNNLYAEGRVLVNLPDVLAVPRSAVLSPGAQAVVYVDAGGGHYEPRKIKTGRVGDELVEILDGLNEGEKVVTTGNLLIDAETQISQSGN